MRYFKNRLNKAWFFLWMIMLVITVFAFHKYFGLRDKNEKMGKEIERMKLENQVLANNVYRLKTDPEYAKKTAEHKLGRAEKGEIIYKILPDEEGR